MKFKHICQMKAKLPKSEIKNGLDWYITTKSGRILALWLAETDKLEVIGNVYENPELIE